MNTDLYIKPVEFEKVSYKRVSDTPADWTGNIMETFYNQFPYFAQTSVSVTLTQKDEAKGYAIGQIMVEEGTGMVVPIIIQNYELFPFDIAIVNGITMPLTNTTLNIYVQGRGAFLKVVKPEAGDITNSLFNTSFSQQIVPSYVTESYKQASAKEDSMIEYIKMQLKAGQAVKNHRTSRALGATVGAIVGVDPMQGAAIGATVGGLDASLAKDPTVFEDQVVDRMGKASLTGGQMKADQLFHEVSERYKMSNSKNDLYIMLCFRKWAVEQGIDTKHWDIPGFEKTGEKEEKEESKKDEKKESKEHESKESKKEEKEEHKDMKEDAKEKEKKASFIDRIAPTVTQQMKDSFFDQIQKNASILEGFKRNGTSDLLLKLAKINPEAIDFKDRVRKELDRDLHYIYKTGSHEWKMILGSSKVNDPVEITIDDVAAGKIEHVKTSATYESVINKYAGTKYAFTTSDGSGYVMLEDDTYAELPPQHVSMVKTASTGKSEHVVGKPCIVKHATWRIGNEHLPVFEVTRIWTDGNKERIEATTGLDKTAYCRMQGIDAPYTEKGITYLPIDAQFIKLGSRVELPEKTVDIYANGNSVYRADNFTYVLRGHTFEEFNKTASADTTLDKALWTTLQLGGTKDDVHAIGQLKVGESYPILHSLNIPISFDKVAAKWNEEFTAASKGIRTEAHKLIKEAAAITDVPTVDAVLALNFVNKNNIQQFADSAHELLQCAQTLASMLLHTRLGVRVVEESVIRRVMLGLIDIVEVLQGIGNLAGKK